MELYPARKQFPNKNLHYVHNHAVFRRDNISRQGLMQPIFKQMSGYNPDFPAGIPTTLASIKKASSSRKQITNTRNKFN